MMLKSDGHVRIIDFGLSKMNWKDSNKFEVVGTLKEMAPEVIRCAFCLIQRWHYELCMTVSDHFVHRLSVKMCNIQVPNTSLKPVLNRSLSLHPASVTDKPHNG